MPPATKHKVSKHQNTPYTRNVKSSKKSPADNDLLATLSTSTNLVESAAKRLYSLVSWVFTSGEDLTKSVGASASKVVHREKPETSLASQLEAGTLHSATTDQDSLLAPDLIPHYLGKTPLAVKGRREPPQKSNAQAFRIPSFNSAQFKIPVLPSPPTNRVDYSKVGPESRATDQPPPRGKGLKLLELKAETQSQHDNDILEWLSEQNLTPQDLVSGRFTQDLKTDDRTKLNHVLADSSFFRRQGLFPPVVSEGKNIAPDSQSNDRRLHRSSSRVSIDREGNERSLHSFQARRFPSRDWQINSSTGILAAWRDICEQQDNVAQSISLSVPQAERSRSRAVSVASDKQAGLWHADISFSQNETPESLQTVPELDVDLIEAGEKYWAPIRSFPMPSGGSKSQGHDERSMQINAQVSHGRSHRRRHSRQVSLAHKSGSRPTNESSRQRLESRPATPTSLASSRQGRSRRPVNASREASRSRQRREASVEAAKPQMVDSQVQTGDELMLFMQDEPNLMVKSTPTISKERRKRPGCFSALDEDLEERFGPYVEQPTKKTKLSEDDAEILLPPRIPILREDEAVKRLRAQQERERAAIIANRAVEQSSVPARLDFGDEPKNAGTVSIQDKDSSTMFSKPFTLVTSTEAESSATKSDSLAGSDVDRPSALSTSRLAAGEDAFDNEKPSHPDQSGPAIKPITGPTILPKFDFSHPAPANAITSDKPRSGPAASFTFSAAGKDKITAPTMPQSLSSTTAAPFKFGGQADASKQTNMTSSGAFNFGITKSMDESPKNDVATTATPGHETSLKTNIPGFSFTPASGSSSTETESLSTQPAHAEPSTAKFSFGSSDVNSKEDSNSSSLSAKQNPSNPTKFQFGQTNAGAPSFNFGQPKTVEVENQSPSTTKSSDTTLNFGLANPVVQNNSANDTGSQASKQTINASPFTFGNSTNTAATMQSQAVNPTAMNSEAQRPPVFTFGQPSDKMTPSFSFGSQDTNSGTSKTEPQQQALPTPAFGQGTTAPASASFTSAINSTSNPFGQASDATNPSNKPPETPTFKNVPSFGNAQTSTASGNSQFGVAAQSTPQPAFSGFGQSANLSFSKPETSQSSSFVPQSQSQSQSQFVFGASTNSNQLSNAMTNFAGNAAASQPSGFTFGQQTSTPVQNSNSSFSFGSSQPATTAPTFGSLQPATTAPTFGASQPATSAPVFQFGTPAMNNAQTSGFSANGNTQNGNTPGFSFGQAQTAPNSGFASPALQSPAIQSATAPGSPNMFDFGAGPAAGAAAPNGARKIAQPRARRKR